MHTETHEATAEPAEPEPIDLDAFTSYEDGDALVICDRENANAWLRSDVTWTLSV